MLDAAVGLAVAVDEALLVVVVVLDSASPGTLEGDLAVPLGYSAGALVPIFLADLEALGLELPDEILKIVSMILKLLIPPHKAQLLLLAPPV